MVEHKATGKMGQTSFFQVRRALVYTQLMLAGCSPSRTVLANNSAHTPYICTPVTAHTWAQARVGYAYQSDWQHTLQQRLGYYP